MTIEGFLGAQGEVKPPRAMYDNSITAPIFGQREDKQELGQTQFNQGLNQTWPKQTQLSETDVMKVALSFLP